MWSGDKKLLMEDIGIFKPTAFVSVPRVFNKIFDKVNQKISNSNFLVKALFNRAMSKKLRNFREKGSFKHWFYDLMVFNKIKNSLGGNVRVMYTGSAPISDEVMNFVRIAF